MTDDVLRVAKRLIPIEELALVETYTPSPDSTITSERNFASRLVLIDRVTVLTEGAPEEISKACGFAFIASEQVGLNCSVHFRVESFSPTENFAPAKAYKSRLIWRDRDGLNQSKLMMSAPEDLLGVVRSGHKPSSKSSDAVPARPRARTSRRSVRRASTQG